MRRDYGYYGLLIVILALAIGFGIANLVWAFDCWGKGGAYITGNGMWPICVKAERL